MNELYFGSKDDIMAYSLDQFKDQMKEEELTEMTVYKAEKYKDDDYFWCREFLDYGEKGQDTCGRWCDKYNPRNGKSGCCTHYSTIFYNPTDEQVILTNETT